MAKHRLGSSKEGTHHFWQQRLTGLANLFLGLSIVAALSFYGRTSHEEVLAWFSQVWMVGLTLAFVFSSLWHMRLGLAIVIDDYVHSEGTRLFFQIINTFITLSGFLAASLALIEILLGNTPTAMETPPAPATPFAPTFPTPNN